VKLKWALSEAGGDHNEDAFGFINDAGDVTAAWVIDGVTGINKRNVLPAATDAIWFVERVQLHLKKLAVQALPLSALLDQLAASLIKDWNDISEGVDLPPDYDLPACCLLYIQKFETGWQALRLGDSYLLSRQDGLTHHDFPMSNLASLEMFLKSEAAERRASGAYDFKALLKEFYPQLLLNRKSRNKPGGYSILEPTPQALAMPQFIELGQPCEILLCTDGFYRCVDHYEMCDDKALMEACMVPQRAEDLLKSMREVEKLDADCRQYLRFKPQDDATVLMLAAT
jgi:serine/threonine protein phosphatase PrpC